MAPASGVPDAAAAALQLSASFATADAGGSHGFGHSTSSASAPNTAPTTTMAARMPMAWADHSVAGSVFPSSSLRTPLEAHLTDVDVSDNAIAELDADALVARVPRLRRLNLAGNLLTTLADVVLLGQFNDLEELDLRGNPCCPSDRAALLAALLVPGISQQSRRRPVSAAAFGGCGRSRLPSACSAGTKAYFPSSGACVGAATTSSPIRGSHAQRSPEDGHSCGGIAATAGGACLLSASASAPLLPLPLPEPQPQVQGRQYRGKHLQSCGTAVAEAEAEARLCLARLRGEGGSQDAAAGVSGAAAAELAPSAEAAARTAAEMPAALTGWRSRHHEELFRRVRCCLPRAHLYKVPIVGDASGGARGEGARGAGVDGWFPSLVILNGQVVTVQDLEDAVSEAAEGPAVAGGGRCFSGSGRVCGGGAPPRQHLGAAAVPTTATADSARVTTLDLSRKAGENCHSHLVRVRIELLRRRRRAENDQKKKKARFYSDAFEQWRTSADESDVEEEPEFNTCGPEGKDDAKSLASVSTALPASIVSLIPSTAASPAPTSVSTLAAAATAPTALRSKKGAGTTLVKDEGEEEQDQKEGTATEEQERAFRAMEAQLWQTQRERFRALGQRVGAVSDDGSDGCGIADRAACPDDNAAVQPWDLKTKLDVRPRSAAPCATNGGQVPPTAGAIATQGAHPRRTAAQRAHRLRPTPHEDFELVKRQVRRLAKTYMTAGTHELHTKVRTTISGIELASDGATGAGRKKGKRTGVGPSDVAPSTRMDAAIQRLRKYGLGLASPGMPEERGKARQQWLRQLAEDYPEAFCRALREEAEDGSGAVVEEEHEEEGPEVVTGCGAYEERIEDAVLASHLWVLDLHGNPSNELDWQPRQVWLSRTGRIWLAPREDGHSCSPDTRPTLYLGGECIFKLQVIPVSCSVEISKTLGGQPAHAMRIISPGARVARVKYLAATDSETRDRWVRICSTTV